MADKGKKKKCGFFCKMIKIVASALIVPPVGAMVIQYFNEDIDNALGTEEPAETPSDHVLARRTPQRNYGAGVSVGRVKQVPTVF